MLAEFEKRRAEFASERKAEQEEADGLCANMHRDISKILLREGRRETHHIRAILGFLRRGYLNYPEELSPEEIGNRWSLSRDVDFGGENHEVTIKAYGNKDPNKATRSFVWINGSPHFIELTRDHGVLWEEEQRGKRTVQVRKQRANSVEARFFETVLNRFQTQASSK